MRRVPAAGPSLIRQVKLAANLSWLYPGESPEQRFAAAARDGFRAVEILQPYDRSAQWHAAALERHGLKAVLINTPVAEGRGRWGLAAIPGAQQAFHAGFSRALEVAIAIACPRIHVMAGDVSGFDASECRETLLRNLEAVLPIAAQCSIGLSLEPLNRIDAPGYFYAQPEQALSIVRHFDTPWLALQLDFYHCVREALDAPAEALRAAPWVGHVQIAGAPGRFEPDLHSDRLLEALGILAESGYTGWIGCEYRPRTDAARGLSWCEPLRARGWLQ